MRERQHPRRQLPTAARSGDRTDPARVAERHQVTLDRALVGIEPARQRAHADRLRLGDGLEHLEHARRTQTTLDRHATSRLSCHYSIFSYHIVTQRQVVTCAGELTMPDYTVSPLDPALPFGIRIGGLTRTMLEDGATRDSIDQLFVEHGMIVFEDVEQSDEMQLAISSCFGPLKEHPVKGVSRVR